MQVGSSLPQQNQKIPVTCSLWLQASQYKHVTQVTHWKTLSGTNVFPWKNSVQLLSHVWLFVTPWTEISLSITNFWTLLKLMSIRLVMQSNLIGRIRGRLKVNFLGGTNGKEPACQCRRYETLIPSLGREDSLEEGMQPTPVFLPGEFHGQRNLEGYTPWGRKESDPTEAT